MTGMLNLFRTVKEKTIGVLRKIKSFFCITGRFFKKHKKIAGVSAAFCVAVVGIVLCILMAREEPDGNWESDYLENLPTVPTETTVTEPLPENYIPSPEGLTDRAKNLLKINSDTAGYIKVPFTLVDYPVLQIPGDRELGFSYYVDYNLYYDKSKEGAIFLDYRNNFGSDESLQSDNLVIYGHDMYDDAVSMFGSLSYYRNDRSFYEKSPVIELSSNYKDYKYKICSIFIEDGGPNSNFYYWNCIDLKTDDAFNYFADAILSRSIVDTGVDLQLGDKFVTLSTCYELYGDTRFVIVGRRLREGEE